MTLTEYVDNVRSKYKFIANSSINYSGYNTDNKNLPVSNHSGGKIKQLSKKIIDQNQSAFTDLHRRFFA